MNRYFFAATFALLFSLLITGCVTTKVPKTEPSYRLVYSSQKAQPSWISIIPKHSKYLYFVGTSSDLPTFDQGKKEAISDALSQVVDTIGITLRSSLTVEERLFAREYTQIVSRELATKGRAKLQDAEIEHIYHEKYQRPDGSIFFRVWVLLKYSKDEIKGEQKRLEAILAMKYREVKRLEKEAEALFSGGKLLDASFSYINAALASLKIEDEGVFFDRNIQKAVELLQMIKLDKLGDNQVGWVGEALPRPLSVKVYLVKDSKENPLSNVPVKFLYRVPKKKTQGYKLHVDRVSTDSMGVARLKIDNIYEVNSKNVVEARIDLEPFLKARLESVPQPYQDRVDMIRAILKEKRVIFTYSSDTRARKFPTSIYFVQLDVDESPITRPLTAPALSSELQQKGFMVTDIDLGASPLTEKSEREIFELLSEQSGKDTKRIIFGVVRILEYDTISGYKTARAEAGAKLFDVEKGRVIRTWHILRSGTGSTKELARQNALLEIGKSFGEIMPRTMP